MNKSTTKYYHNKTKLINKRKKKKTKKEKNNNKQTNKNKINAHCVGLKETTKMLVNNNISDRKD